MEVPWKCHESPCNAMNPHEASMDVHENVEYVQQCVYEYLFLLQRRGKRHQTTSKRQTATTCDAAPQHEELLVSYVAAWFASPTNRTVLSAIGRNCCWKCVGILETSILHARARMRSRFVAQPMHV